MISGFRPAAAGILTNKQLPSSGENNHTNGNNEVIIVVPFELQLETSEGFVDIHRQIENTQTLSANQTAIDDLLKSNSRRQHPTLNTNTLTQIQDSESSATANKLPIMQGQFASQISSDEQLPNPQKSVIQTPNIQFVSPQNRPSNVSSEVEKNEAEPVFIFETISKNTKKDVPLFERTGIKSTKFIKSPSVAIAPPPNNSNLETLITGIVKSVSQSNVSGTPNVPESTTSSHLNLALQVREKTSYRPSVQTLQIQLQPQNLGPIEVKLQKIENQISIEIETKNTLAEAILRTQLSTLSRALEQIGITLDELKILHNTNAENLNQNNSNLANHLSLKSENNFQSDKKNDPKFSSKDQNAAKDSTENTTGNPYREGIYL